MRICVLQIVLVALLGLVLAVVSSATAETCRPDGDVDRDGQVTSTDAVLVFLYTLGFPLTECQQLIGDVVPERGSIGVADAVCIFEKASGNSSCLDMEEPDDVSDTEPETPEAVPPQPYEQIDQVPYQRTAIHAPIVPDGTHHIETVIGGGGKYPLRWNCLHSCLTLRPDHYGDGHSKGFGVGHSTTSHLDERHVTTAGLIAYLEDDATGGTVARWADPPTIRLTDSVADLMLIDTLRAVRRINSALPNDWRLDFDDLPYDDRGQELFRPADGEIVISFTKPSTRYGDPSGGAASWWRNDDGAIVAGHITVDPTYWTHYAEVKVPNSSVIHHTGRRIGRAVLIRELILTLGRKDAHYVPFLTIMRRGINADLNYGSERAFWLLDRDALLAVYGWLGVGDTVDDIAVKLAGWEMEHPYMFNSLAYKDLDEIHLDSSVSFGVVMNNGAAQPWARGPRATVALADFLDEAGTELDGLLTWRGELMGFTPDMRVVTGDVRFDIDPHTIGARLEINNLHSWPWGVNPENTAGEIWGDGDLFYTIGMDAGESIFADWNGDTGLVTGSLFDASDGFGHLQGVGGVVEIVGNLTAAFGAICDAGSGFRFVSDVQMRNRRTGESVCYGFGSTR